MGMDKLRVALNRSGGLEIQPKRAGVAARAHERDNVERLCRCVSRPPVAALVPRPRVNLITKEPNTTWWDRFKVGFAGLLPIKSQL
jgi:hypothetical protein